MQIRHFMISVILLTFCSFCNGQDGSDIKYYTTSALDSSFIGKEVHLDFYHRSFGGRHLDTITITLFNRQIRYLERRVDNGYNNWFSEQFLESIDSSEGMKTRINSWTILTITTDSIQVKPSFTFTMRGHGLINKKYWEEPFWFNKAIIKEILVKSKLFGS